MANRKRTRQAKWFGKLRKCKAPNQFFGFQIQPGMWFGQDNDGYFATYGDRHGDLYAVYRSTKKCPVSSDDWDHILEPMDSVLTGKLDLMDTDERREMMMVREGHHKANMRVAKRSLIAAKEMPFVPSPVIKKKLSEFKPARKQGLRESKAYLYDARGRRPVVRERNMVDVDPTYKPRLCVNYLPD